MMPHKHPGHNTGTFTPYWLCLFCVPSVGAPHLTLWPGMPTCWSSQFMCVYDWIVPKSWILWNWWLVSQWLINMYVTCQRTYWWILPLPLLNEHLRGDSRSGALLSGVFYFAVLWTCAFWSRKGHWQHQIGTRNWSIPWWQGQDERSATTELRESAAPIHCLVYAWKERTFLSDSQCHSNNQTFKSVEPLPDLPM